MIEIKKRLNAPTRAEWMQNGFVNRTDSTISFNDGLRRFTIAPAVSSYVFYSNGKKFTKIASETVDITDTEGLWFFYFTSAGVLTASQTPWSFTDGTVFIAIGYWDATNNSLIGFGEERHGMNMSPATHQYLHNNFGAQWYSGFTPSVLADEDGSLASHCEIQSISSGVLYDEDIPHNSAEQTTYEIWYKSGANAYWRKNTASAAAVYKATTRPYYNQYTGGAWQLTEVANTKYTLTHIFATNSTASGKAILIMGENEYTSKANAQAGAETEITQLTTGDLPTAEFTPIATLIIQCNDAYTNTYNARIVTTAEGSDFVDFRTSEKTGVGAIVSDHGNLTGLGDDDHTQYILIDGSRAFTGAPTISYDIKGETKCWDIILLNPNAYYSIDTQFPIAFTKSALTITRIDVSLNTTAQNIAGDLKFADDLTSFTNATVINVCDTTSGVLSNDTSFNDATIPANKWIYFEFDSQANSAITYMIIHVEWDYD